MRLFSTFLPVWDNQPGLAGQYYLFFARCATFGFQLSPDTSLLFVAYPIIHPYDPPMPTFTHLQVHSHYTLLGGTATIPQLIDQAVAHDLPALALTDTHALYGVVPFVRACHAAHIQPIVGMTVRVAVSPGQVTAPPQGTAGQLVLLAANPSGYRSLCRLSSHLQGHPHREARLRQGLSWDDLKANQAGLICLEGGRMGWLERYLRAGDRQSATHYAARLGGIFQENCYLSVSLYTPEDVAIGTEIAALGQRFGLPPVAVHPIYCLSPDDTPRLRLLAAIDHNCHVDAVPDTALPAYNDPTVPLHWQPPDEISGRFAAELPPALTAVQEIITRCGDCLPHGRSLWPALNLPDEQSPHDALTQQAAQGLLARYGREADTAVHDRLQNELAVIGRYGFAPLFLIVADIVRFARQQHIPVSTRGSVANSLVAYCLHITTIDPIAHALIFERFLNPARANLPDIDLDFCSRRRDEVFNYVRHTYGPDQVALVATLNRLQPKSAVRETAKAYGWAEKQLKPLLKRLPRDPQELEAALAQIETEPARDLIRRAYQLIGQPHHLSVHPGGIVITPGPLTDTVPVQWARKGFLVTQYDQAHLETIGLPKIDLLGIRALTVLADTADFIRTHHDPHFALDTIPLDDETTGRLLANGHTIGVFQCESVGAQRTLRQLQAQNVSDLVMANAFFKPGPATGGMAKAFIRRYRGEEPVTYLHPALKPILAATQGVLLFQEQVLQIACHIAGLTWGQADHLRRGMSKLNAREMNTMRRQFILGCQHNKSVNLSPQQAETLWDQVAAFAGYGFNQGHATAYADISYRSAYLKAHWPAQFLWARLANAGGFYHQMIYIAEAVRLGIAVHPPHINVSQRRFTLTYETETQQPTLWMGLGQIRDVRQTTIDAIITARAQKPFATLRDLLTRVPMLSKEITHLIQCGGLDGFAGSRAALLAEAQGMVRAGNTLQMAFDFAQNTAVSPKTPAQRLAWEQHLLGVPMTHHPLDLTTAVITTEDTPLRQLPRFHHSPTTIVGVRLPGWTGSKGFFFGDGEDFVLVKMRRQPPPSTWQPTRLHGQWRVDEWGGGWFEVVTTENLSLKRPSPSL